MKKIEVYTTDFCSYCEVVKRLLRSKGIPFEEINIADAPERREELLARTGEWTVPQVFIDGEYIGQDDELRALMRSGEFDKMVGLE